MFLLVVLPVAQACPSPERRARPTSVGDDDGMNILPGVGVEAVRVGESRVVVEQRLGSPAHAGDHSRAVYTSLDPTLVVFYDEDAIVQLVEVGYAVADQAFFDGVQLTYRFMDDVIADLRVKGHVGSPVDTGFVLHPGFAIFSMRSLSARDVDPYASEEDPRRVVEGVSVAPYTYLVADQPPLNGTLDELEEWLRQRGVLPNWS